MEDIKSSEEYLNDGDDFCNFDFDGYRFLKPLFDSSRLQNVQRQNYIDWVNSVIIQRNSNSNSNNNIDIHRFRVDYDLNIFSSSSIDNWIRFALENRVQILDLNLLEIYDLRGVNRNYTLHQNLFFPNGNSLINYSLKVLRLKAVNVSGEFVEFLLSKCPNLEQLQIVDSLKLLGLRISGGPSLALKHLELKYCDKIRSIEIIDALNLVSFHCECFEDFYRPYEQFRIVVQNVPKLVDVYLFSSFPIYFGRVFTTLSSSCLSQLQVLELNLSQVKFKDFVKNVEYPMLTNLKQLILNLNPSKNFILFQIITFLKVSPHLQTLELKFWAQFLPRKNKDRELTSYPHPHHNLKEVKIVGYSGGPFEDEVILYFVDNAVSLEKIIIDTRLFRGWPPSRRQEEINQNAKDHALHCIKEKIPSTIKLICL